MSAPTYTLTRWDRVSLALCWVLCIATTGLLTLPTLLGASEPAIANFCGLGALCLAWCELLRAGRLERELSWTRRMLDAERVLRGS